MLRSIIRKTSPMSCSSSDLEICTSEQCLFEWRMLEYCTYWLAGSPSCWSYNSQEIASLISHLLQKDFLLPALNRELFQFLISLAVTCHLVTGAARWNDLRLFFILQKENIPDKRTRMSRFKPSCLKRPRGLATVWGSYRGSGTSSSAGTRRGRDKWSGRNGNFETQERDPPEWRLMYFTSFHSTFIPMFISQVSSANVKNQLQKSSPRNWYHLKLARLSLPERE